MIVYHTEPSRQVRGLCGDRIPTLNYTRLCAIIQTMSEEQRLRLLHLLRGVIRGRWIIIFGATSVGVVQKIVGGSSVSLSPVYMASIIGLASLINLVYFLIVRRENASETSLFVVKYLQIPVDQIIFSAVVYFTGGIESLSFVFYVLPVLISTVLYSSAAILGFAFLTAFFYASIVVMEWFAIIPHQPRYNFDPGIFHTLDVTINNSLVVVATILLSAGFATFIARIIRDRENELMTERDKTVSTIQSLTDGIIIIDMSDRILLMNPRAEEYVGSQAHELAGTTIEKPREGDQPTNIQRVFWQSGEAENVESQEVSLQAREKFDLEVVSIPLLNVTGEREGTVKVLHDITREKVIDRMKSEFLSIAAHQLRTPLSAVKWAMKLIMDGDAGAISSEQKELMRKGYESNERMISLVNDLLDVTRIEEGRFHYKFAMSKIEDVIKSVTSEFTATIKNRNVKFEMQLPPHDMPPVKIDPEKMRLVVQNVLENAFNYTLDGGSVTLRASYDDAAQKILVEVKDTGVGIPADQQDKIFTRFFRAHNVVRMRADGTGLGLYIVRNIVLKHGGDVWFESEEGKGTTVTFSVPIEKRFAPERPTQFEGFMESI